MCRCSTFTGDLACVQMFHIHSSVHIKREQLKHAYSKDEVAHVTTTVVALSCGCVM